MLWRFEVAAAGGVQCAVTSRVTAASDETPLLLSPADRGFNRLKAPASCSCRSAIPATP